MTAIHLITSYLCQTFSPQMISEPLTKAFLSFCLGLLMSHLAHGLVSLNPSVTPLAVKPPLILLHMHTCV